MFYKFNHYYFLHIDSTIVPGYARGLATKVPQEQAKAQRAVAAGDRVSLPTNCQFTQPKSHAAV